MEGGPPRDLEAGVFAWLWAVMLPTPVLPASQLLLARTWAWFTRLSAWLISVWYWARLPALSAVLAAVKSDWACASNDFTVTPAGGPDPAGVETAGAVVLGVVVVAVEPDPDPVEGAVPVGFGTWLVAAAVPQ